ARSGAQTSNDTRFLRWPWEVDLSSIEIVGRGDRRTTSQPWAPFIAGAKGLRWIDPLSTVVDWGSSGLQIRTFNEHLYGSHTRTVKNEDLYWKPGVAFSTIGNTFSARLHRSRSIFGSMGASVFPESEEECFRVLCLLNSSLAQEIVGSLNPGIHFTGGDINRLPVVAIADAEDIGRQLVDKFSQHEAACETSHAFRHPGPSPWLHAQDWAQSAVDRPKGAPLPEYVERLDPEPSTDHLSFALGVALGRFGLGDSLAEGILDPVTADLSHALPHGILFLDTILDAEDRRDGLGHPAAAPLHAAWAKHSSAIGTRRSLRDWLALDFFKDVHKGMYKNRPVHWPLSSASKSFVAWVNIHRMTSQTLRVLLADHLAPTLVRLDGELADLAVARDGINKKAARDAERQYDRVFKARSELREFIASVEQCADRGAPPTDGKCPGRQQDARYDPDLDDGVMINSAAIWPLLDPQWKEPRKWWKELATATSRRDYDWSHLAMRYWPDRVDRKCRNDPSLGVAHGCFWRYHPERAWIWELRLQDEIGPEFRIEEEPYRPSGRDLDDPGDRSHRHAFLRDEPKAALAAIEREAIRRMGRGKNRKVVSEMRILETGLWAAHAEALWDIELKLAKRQGTEIRILAPDEPAARAVFEAAHPDRVQVRKSVLADLVPPVELFDDEADEAADDDANADGEGDS
ncbi:BREX-6 system adenine-specific DNA-methyltransferase PglX, partial [Frankia sp. ACN1ag]|uniref:BREX-6 system adenine-specific DNA-methyltransferase PglX n=1 Tax=Frankia sp. ACN1ag TaxID=102891 RepID=UPI001F424665